MNVLTFTPFCLELCIWSDAISRWIQQEMCIKFCTNLEESAAVTLTVINQVFMEESLARTQVFEWKSLKSQRPKRQNRWRANWRVCSLFSLACRGLSTKNSLWQTKQTILHTSVTFYGDCMNMCEDFSQKNGDKYIVCCIITPSHTSFSTTEC